MNPQKFYVYVLKSVSRRYLYVGMTSDVERRLNEHNGGENKTTRPYRPFKIVLRKEFNSRSEARVYEKKLKTGHAKEYIKKLIDY